MVLINDGRDGKFNNMIILIMMVIVRLTAIIILGDYNNNECNNINDPMYLAMIKLIVMIIITDHYGSRYNKGNIFYNYNGSNKGCIDLKDGYDDGDN